jgi:pimeloyl-ACP methyl ester carboxylesterase
MKKVLLLILTLGWAGMAWSQPLNPRADYKVRPDKYGLKYEEYQVDTEDGAKLNVWFFANQGGTSAKFVLVSHDGQGNMSDHIDRVYRFTSKGYNVVFYDYRGFGGSSPYAYDANLYISPFQTKDITAMLNHVRYKYSNIIYVYGWGVGATLSLGAGVHMTQVYKIAADSPANNLEGIRKRYKDNGQELEIPPFGFDKSQEPEYALDKRAGNTCEILLMLGDADPYFNLKDAAVLIKKTKKAEQWSLKGLKQNELFDNDKDVYIDRIVQFFDRKNAK